MEGNRSYFSKDDTNIQKAYNRIYGKKEERLKHSKITNMNYVIENMLDNYPKAKKFALEELKLAKLISVPTTWLPQLKFLIAYQ